MDVDCLLQKLPEFIVYEFWTYFYPLLYKKKAGKEFSPTAFSSNFIFFVAPKRCLAK